MKLPRIIWTLLAAATLTTGCSHQLETPKSAVPPVASVSPPKVDVANLLATREELAAFHQESDPLVRTARSPEEQRNLIERFRQRAAKESSAGLKRLFRLQILQLAESAETPAQLAARARDLLVLLHGDDPDLQLAQNLILTELHRRLPADENFSADAIIRSDELLASTYFNHAMYNQAAACLDAARDLAAAEKVAEPSTLPPNFPQQVQLHLRGQNALAKDPQDAAATTTRALIELQDEKSYADAATLLAKSSQPSLQKLAHAVSAMNHTLDSRTAAVQAGLQAMQTLGQEDRSLLAKFLARQHRAVQQSDATDEQKAALQRSFDQAKQKFPEIDADAAIWIGCPPNNTPPDRIIYLIDCSARLGEGRNQILQEVERSSAKLLTIQIFNAVLISDHAESVFQKSPCANVDAKKAFAAKLKDYHPGPENSGNLAVYQDAFEKAMAMAPHRIFFVTDGEFDPRLTDLVQDLNSSGTAKISTICFLKPDPAAEMRLKKIAAENDGTYKFVRPEDLAH